jgi:hypothetical protein
MSIRSLKHLIFSLTDFEFLASIHLVDFERKKIDIKRQFFNRLIGQIKAHVEITTRKQLTILVNNIKEIYLQRLGLVSTHSFFRYFFKNIKIVFQSFSRRISRFFETGNNILSTPLKKQRKRKTQKNKTIEIPPVPELTKPTSETEESEEETVAPRRQQEEHSIERLDRFGLPYHGQAPPSESESEDSETEEENSEEERSQLEDVDEDEEIIAHYANSEDPSDTESARSEDSDESNCISGTGMASCLW